MEKEIREFNVSMKMEVETSLSVNKQFLFSCLKGSLSKMVKTGRIEHLPVRVKKVSIKRVSAVEP